MSATNPKPGELWKSGDWEVQILEPDENCPNRIRYKALATKDGFRVGEIFDAQFGMFMEMYTYRDLAVELTPKVTSGEVWSTKGANRRMRESVTVLSVLNGIVTYDRGEGHYGADSEERFLELHDKRAMDFTPEDGSTWYSRGHSKLVVVKSTYSTPDGVVVFLDEGHGFRPFMVHTFHEYFSEVPAT